MRTSIAILAIAFGAGQVLGAADGTAARASAAEAAFPSAAQGSPAVGATAEVKQIEWEDLLPENERGSYGAAPPPPRHDYLSGEYGVPAMQSLSFNVNKALDGKIVKLPGFLVPLEADGKGKVVEFFLVPYFGACIHVPPPPPNQIVFVKFEQGIALDSVYEAYWITGRLEAMSKSTRYGAAAYTLRGQRADVYKY